MIIGVAALPLLYAWFNIIANWDPYGSTGNILFAVVNEDKGADFEGLELNLGSQVELETIDVFPVENYGSAMTPFYSVLAIWVGGIVLVAVIKTNVKDKSSYKNVKHYQEYLGRYLFFLVMAVIQAVIICLGIYSFLKYNVNQYCRLCLRELYVHLYFH